MGSFITKTYQLIAQKKWLAIFLLLATIISLVALISISIYFFDTLSNSGSEQYILQKKNLTDADLNTAWTVDITSKSLLALVLIISSDGIASFFGQDELSLALSVSSIVLVINALKNPGIYVLKKNFDYQSIFWLSLWQKLITFVVVISIAVSFKNYWALIVGDIVSSFIFTVGSYQIYDFRPNLSIKKIQELTKNESNAIVYGFFKNTDKIASALFEIEKTKQVLKNIEDDGDRVAISELQKILSSNQILLNHYVLDTLYNQNDVSWICRGRKLNIKNKKELNKQLSLICDDIYSQTPIIKNELFNKYYFNSTLLFLHKSRYFI